jgi:hypothetical protein
MAKLFDENGNEVAGAMTKEEHETALTAAVDTAKTEAVDTYKKENPPAETPPAKKEGEEEETTETAEQIAERIASKAVATALRQRDIQDMARAYAPADAAKQAEIIANAARLTGYEETPEGLASQVEAAAKVAGIDTAGVDISGVTGTGGGRNVDTTSGPAPTEADSTVQKALGITSEDVEKFAPKEGEAKQ